MIVLLFTLLLTKSALSFETAANLSEYGVDISYPIHHYIDGKGFLWLFAKVLL